MPICKSYGILKGCEKTEGILKSFPDFWSKKSEMCALQAVRFFVVVFFSDAK